MNENNVGIAFAMMGLSYGLGALFAGWICSKMSRIVIMQLGLLLLGASCLLIGPSVFFNLPNKIWIILIGISANAFFGAWLVVPVTPEIIESVEIQLKAKWSQEYVANGLDEAHVQHEVDLKFKKISNKLTDKASALQNMAYALGSDRKSVV